jgi:hypothetical protein
MSDNPTVFFDCRAFEDRLSDFIEGTLSNDERRIMLEHTISCPVCHELLNDVKQVVAACSSLAEPRLPLTRLEAKILTRTAPEFEINCREFEDYLTDYLDGFLPADVFHRWERHAAICTECSDLPGAVVRALGTLVTFKTEELPLPAGLAERILQATIGTVNASEIKPPLAERFRAFIQFVKLPVSLGQLAPVAMMLLVAFLVLTEAVGPGGRFTDVYAKSFQLAEQTYRQGADVINEASRLGSTNQNNTEEQP